MLYLTACALNNLKPDAERIAAIDFEKLYEMCQFHSLTATVCTALESAEIFNEKFNKAKSKAIRKNILLDAESKKIFSFLEENGIWYIPLKGAVLKEMYPEIGMRQMSDIDILYDKSHRAQILEYMQNCGYTAKSVGKIHHDEFTKPPIFNIEMHTKLFSERSGKAFVRYYSNVKSRLLQDSGKKYAYHFTDEDFYVYITAHEYKHFSSSGTGLRSLADRYVYLRAKGASLDWDYITKQLEALSISEFEQSSRELSEKVLSNTSLPALSDEEKEMLEYYLFSGTYGTDKNKVKNGVQKADNSKLKYFFKRIFPDSDFIKTYYPFFYRHKYLIPFLWVFRIARGFTVKRKKISSEIKNLKGLKL